MTRLYKKVKKRGFLPPGTILHPNGANGNKATIKVFDYTQTEMEEINIEHVEQCAHYKNKDSVTWINMEGMNTNYIQKIGEYFGIHPLVSEDIVNTGQRPKVEDYGDYLFVVIKMIYVGKEKNDMISEQISLIIGKNYVISFQEKEGDVFNPIRERIHSNNGRIRKMGADYLAYSLLDAVVDQYFVILENKGEQIDALEEQLMTNGNSEASREIHNYKREMVFLRKQIWPLREVLSSLQRGESELITKTTGIYLRDVYDHTIQVVDTIESFRDILHGMHDMHMTNISNKMNEVMKVLTIIATIFIPITFMAGIYGMNFDHIPELHWRGSYFVFWIAVFLVVGGMTMYFKKKKWF